MDQQHKVRIVTAASLFDGHDAAINIMRRILQSKGAEIIHLGHNRSVKEIVECAIEEDANAIAITSYQGGHVEFFKYMKDLLDESGSGHIKIFGGGGGTILPAEIDELHQYGIEKIYSPDDGRQMGLEGMIEDLIKRSGPLQASPSGGGLIPESARIFPLGEKKDIRLIARAITLAEQNEDYSDILTQLKSNVSSEVLPPGEDLGGAGGTAVLGITGTGGAGKSSVTDELVRRFLHHFPDKTIAVISVDPSKKKTGGALLGDRIRMNAISHPRAYMRSMATRDDNTAISQHAKEAIAICRAAGYDLVILESAGVGQSDAAIIDYCDVSMYVMTPEYGAASQLEKINMLDYADVICINKFDKAGALDALNDVCKQYKRNHNLWTAKNEELPVIGTIASQFNDDGVNRLFDVVIRTLKDRIGVDFGDYISNASDEPEQPKTPVIPAKRIRYLSELSETIRNYNNRVNEQSGIATRLYQLDGSIKTLKNGKE